MQLHLGDTRLTYLVASVAVNVPRLETRAFEIRHRCLDHALAMPMKVP